MKIKRKEAYVQAISQAVLYLAQDSQQVALDSIDEIERAETTLAVSPGIGRLYDSDHSKLVGVRVYGLPRFKSHLVFYLQDNE